MFTSFDEKTFWKAVEEKDYVCLKVNTVSSMLDDPTFARGETMKVLEILDDKVPEIFEDEIRLDYEERLDRSAWDKRYFTKLTYWFQENFAKSRVAYIKEVGSVVHKDTAQKYDASLGKRPSTQTTQPAKKPTMQSRQTTPSKPTSGTQQRPHVVNPTKAPTEKERKVPAVGVIAAAAVLVLVVVLLIKLLSQ